MLTKWNLYLLAMTVERLTGATGRAFFTLQRQYKTKVIPGIHTDFKSVLVLLIYLIPFRIKL